MILKTWVAVVCCVLALAVALGGRVRAADDASPGDTDDIALDADDSPGTLHQELTLEPPPRASTRVVPPAPATGHGRRASVELFRPPIS